MGETSFTLIIDGEEKQVKQGTTFLSLAREAQKDFSDDIVLVSFDNQLRELSKTVQKSGTLTFLTTTSSAGKKAYRRSLLFIMQKAYAKLFAGDGSTVCADYTLGNAMYCHLRGGKKLSQTQLEQLRKEMQVIVDLDEPFEKKSMNTRDAVEYFAAHGMHDKERLFHYRRASRVNVYMMGDYGDYYYGYMVPSTGYLKYFDLQLYEDGFVLVYPDKDAKTVRPFEGSPKFYRTLKESSEWGEMLGVRNIGELNDAIAAGKIQNIILAQEALMEKKIGALAEKIAASGQKKFILIAGPSSSGKTTFSHRLSVQLMAKGLHPHPFPLDDYYLNHDLTPLDEDGNPDYECLEALDVKQLNEDLSNLLLGKTVETPKFNFKTGKREDEGKLMQLGEQDVLVIEGIHGLNDKLSYSIAPEHKFKIYISALTQLNIDEHNYLPTTDGRLLRRIVRDARTRGSGALETIAMWDSVRRGEEKNIFPHQEHADEIFNSALIYELAVLKTYAEPLLFTITPDCKEYQEAKRLLKFLDYFLPLPSETIGSNSILREFIGGGCFRL